ncbi:hypothetical protein D5S17_06500 [Pseudonocardiaceae bacterium YIM PH 21723]|nr:hypothetical protein D5S17_06500 [Pseudonocardiaceae bacterium YIM PH 21723]
MRTLGVRSDLMLIRLQGGIVEDRDGYSVVRLPSNPHAYSGHLLVLPEPPRDVEHWIGVFQAEFPGAEHVLLALDCPHETVPAGPLIVELSAVLTAERVHPPPRPNREARIRPLVSDVDWAALLELNMANNDVFSGPGYVPIGTATWRTCGN